MGREDVSARCNAIEECYEFMLAYAGQGLSGKENSQSSSHVREYLNRGCTFCFLRSAVHGFREENDDFKT